MGFGVHSSGSDEWNGRADSFAQYNRFDPKPLGRTVWGVYADVGAFYDQAIGPWNRLNSVLRASEAVDLEFRNGDPRSRHFNVSLCFMLCAVVPLTI